MKNILVVLLLNLSCWSCIYDIGEHLEKVNREYSPIFKLAPTDSIRANGMDTVQIRVVFPVPPDSNLAKANFTTTEGVFLANNKMEYTASQLFFESSTQTRFVYANLKASTNAGTYRVNIEVPKVKLGFVWVKFGRSYPVTITTDKDKFSVTKSYKDEIQLTANLKASVGLPNTGTKVSFKVLANSVLFTTDSPSNIGNFRNLTTTDSNGRASVFFTPGDLGAFTGPVSYTASATNASNTTIFATGNFQIIP